MQLVEFGWKSQKDDACYPSFIANISIKGKHLIGVSCLFLSTSTFWSPTMRYPYYTSRIKHNDSVKRVILNLYIRQGAS